MNTDTEYRRIPTPLAKNVYTFPILYKRTNTGAVMAWSILVRGSEIGTSYGIVGGAMQTTSDLITEGKNLGKKNATTPPEQAILEARARWRKKIEREGYVPSLERAGRGETDAQGGLAPMLAQPLKDASRHLKYPCDAQPKFNGVRCIAQIQDGAVSLWSRKRTPIFGVPHVIEAYEKAFLGTKGIFILDGELYCHGWSLQRIGGFVRKKNDLKDGYQQLSHWVYDIPSLSLDPWLDRRDALTDLFERALNSVAPVVQQSPTVTLVDPMDTKRLHDGYVAEGYEGLILRNHAAIYEIGKRSYHLIKMKEFLEMEFRIVDVTSGRGRMAEGAIFVCAVNDQTFEVVAPGTMEDKAEFLRRKADVIGKDVTVKFLEWTEGGLPSHGVAVAVRDYE